MLFLVFLWENFYFPKSSTERKLDTIDVLVKTYTMLY
jgi:hypothetical protein